MSAGHNVVTTAPLRSPWTRTFPHSREKVHDANRCMEISNGLPSSHHFVRHEQSLCYSFFQKISEVTIKTVQLLPGRFKSCCNSRVSMMLRGERPFCAARNIVALWDSSATFPPFVANFMMAGLFFLPRMIIWCTMAPCPRRALVLSLTKHSKA